MEKLIKQYLVDWDILHEEDEIIDVNTNGCVCNVTYTGLACGKMNHSVNIWYVMDWMLEKINEDKLGS